jgi:hypothetical protein
MRLIEERMMRAGSLIAMCALVACSPPPHRPDPATPAQARVVEDPWWTAAQPCPPGSELHTDALRFADGSRRTLAVFCQDREARVGRETAWYSNGALRSRGAYDGNRPTGDWVLYWPNGKPWYRVTLDTGRPVRHGAMFAQDGTPLAINVDVPVTGVPECDDYIRESVQKPAERAEAMQLGELVITELENKHRDALGRCGSSDDPVVVVPDDPAFVATFARWRTKQAGTCAAPASGALAGIDLDDREVEEMCKACGFQYHQLPYPQPESCSSLPAQIAGLPLAAGTCPDNELSTDIAPFGERLVLDHGVLLPYTCHASMEHELDRGLWKLTLPIAAGDSTAAASERVLAVVGPMFGKLERATEAFTRYEDPAHLREIVVAREPMRSNDNRMSPAQFKALGLAGYVVIEVSRMEPPDDEARHPRGK